MTDGHLLLALKRHPLDCETVFAEAQSGMTIAQMLGEGASQTCSVSIDGDEVPAALWPLVKPKLGRTIHIVMYPQGGNAGKWVRLVALVVLTYFTAGIASGAYGAVLGVSSASGLAALGAGLMVAGTLAINALVPPPTPKGLGGNGDPFNQLARLTGTSNQLNPYGVVPCVVGTVLDYFPPHAAMPYTEISGDDQYMRMLLDIGLGDDLDVSDIVIGETPITDYEGVEYEVTRTPTLFTQDIYEAAVNAALADGDSVTRTSQTGCTELSVDFAFPQGLFAVDKKGNFVSAVVPVVINFRAVGTTTWYGVAAPTPGITISSAAMHQVGTLSNYDIRSNRNKSLSVGIRWKVAPGQYEVKVDRGTAGWDASVQQSTGMVWAVFRSISPQAPSSTGTTKLVVRIKATDQLQGVVQNLKCRVAQRIAAYDSGSGTYGATAETQNPGVIYPWLMTRCPATLRPLTDDRLDLDDFAAWASECAAKGFNISFVMDSARALGDWLRDVLAAGRASHGQRNGKYSAVRDLPQTVPVQMFTPRNSWNFKCSRTYGVLPHALRVKFTNPEAGSQQDTRLVYADGYNAGNATLFEMLDLSMVVDPDTAWQLGRYHLAVIYNRPNQYTLNVDFEFIRCDRGDLVDVAHDIIGWGLAWGRVKSVDGSRIVLDGPFTPEPGKSYALRVRRADGLQVESTGLEGVITWDSTLITFDSSMSWDSDEGPTRVFATSPDLGVQPGDLYTLGEVNKVTAPLIVRKIAPASDITAELTLVDAAPAVWAADSGTPPVFVSEITGKSWCAAPDPPVLSIRVGTAAVDNAGLAGNEFGFSGRRTGGLYRLPSYKLKQLGLLEP